MVNKDLENEKTFKDEKTMWDAEKFSRVVRVKMAELGIKTLKDLAKQCELNPSQLTAWTIGAKEPRYESVERIATALGVEVVALYSQTKPLKTPSGTSAAIIKEVIEYPVPLLGVVRAGPFQLAESNDEYCNGIAEDKDKFALRIDGKSMSPDYKPGDLVFFTPQDILLSPMLKSEIVRVPYNKISWLHEKDCVLLLDGESNFKRLKIEKKTNGSYKIHIVPVNPDFDSKEVRHDSEFRVQGVFFKLVRK